MSNNFGSTRTDRLSTGTKVLCVHSRFSPKHVKRDGTVIPEKNLTQVLSGTVISDSGKSVYVKAKFPSGRTKSMSFFPHEVTVDSPEILKTFRNPLGG